MSDQSEEAARTAMWKSITKLLNSARELLDVIVEEYKSDKEREARR